MYSLLVPDSLSRHSVNISTGSTGCSIARARMPQEQQTLCNWTVITDQTWRTRQGAEISSDEIPTFLPKNLANPNFCVKVGIEFVGFGCRKIGAHVATRSIIRKRRTTRMTIYIIIGLLGAAALVITALNGGGGSASNRYNNSDNDEVRAALEEERRLTRNARKTKTVKASDESADPGRPAEQRDSDRVMPRRDNPNYPRHIPK